MSDPRTTSSSPPAIELISIVIPAKNAEATLAAQLDAVASQSCSTPFEVVVVDDGSHDATPEIARRYDARLAISIVQGPGRGAAAARNAGVAASRGDLLVFCDADDVVSEGWLAALARVAATGAGLVAGILDYRRLNSVAVQARQGPSAHASDDTPDFLPKAPSCNLAVRRDLLQRCGGWDDSFSRAGAEDIDFCWRVQLSGGTFANAPDAVVHYRLRPGLRAQLAQIHQSGLDYPLLYKKYRAHGMRRSGLVRPILAWPALALRLPWSLRRRETFVRWLRHAARKSGRLRGSIRHRVFYL